MCVSLNQSTHKFCTSCTKQDYVIMQLNPQSAQVMPSLEQVALKHILTTAI